MFRNLPIVINWRLLLILILAFIAFTVIGTLSHEFGHYIAAKWMGFNSTITYAMTKFADEGKEMTDTQYFLITMGGPLQTMVTGTLGLLLLFRTVIRKDVLSKKQWLLVFISLFWLRQSANFAVWAGMKLLTAKVSAEGDEMKLSYYLNWPPEYLVMATGVIGFVVLAIIVFRVIPLRQRFTFLLGGFVGGVAGYFLWLESLGKLIMP